MSMIRWRRDPFFSQLANLQDEVSRRYEGGQNPLAEGEDLGARFTPPMDISEDTEKYTVRAELPGLKPEDISIDLTGRTLTIKGEKKQESETRDENYHRIERSYGTFIRRVEMPQGVDAERVTADYDKGVLSVTVAKAEALKPRQIEIKTVKK